MAALTRRIQAACQRVPFWPKRPENVLGTEPPTGVANGLQAHTELSDLRARPSIGSLSTAYANLITLTT
eukprot:3130064-Pyramimonas_sp.AAC.1